MALHKIIDNASGEDCEIDDYDTLPVHEVDDDFDTVREMLFEDHDVLLLFNKSMEKFWLGQVDSPTPNSKISIHQRFTRKQSPAPHALQSCAARSGGVSAFPARIAAPSQPAATPLPQAAVDTMGAANLHPSAWFLAFKPDRAADHAPAPAAAPPRRAGLRSAALRGASPARAPAEGGARRRRAAVVGERAPSPEEEPRPKRRAAAMARAAARR